MRLPIFPDNESGCIVKCPLHRINFVGRIDILAETNITRIKRAIAIVNLPLFYSLFSASVWSTCRE